MGWFLHDGYVERRHPEPFDDAAITADVVHQPDVYTFAAHLARRHGCTTIIDVGCGSGRKLAALAPEFRIVGIDLEPAVEHCATMFPQGVWITHDFSAPRSLRLPVSMLREAVIVCADVVEHLVDPRALLAWLRSALELAPVAVISTPDRLSVRGEADRGPPANPSHVREWSTEELGQLLGWARMPPRFIGFTMNNSETLQKRTTLAVCEGRVLPEPTQAPAAFSVLAIVTAFNERDIIEAVVTRLLKGGIWVHVLDNWSNDGTYETLRQLEMSGSPIVVERFPPDGPVNTYQWKRILRRVEEVAEASGADWVLHHDADEMRDSPWPQMSLRDALHYSELRGFNAIDFTVLDFQPTGGHSFSVGDPERSLHCFEFGSRPGHYSQIKAWRNTGVRVDLASSGGHEASFDGRKVEPYNYLTKHYPVRSNEHGTRKVLLERRPRWDPGERADGMHSQYDTVYSGHSFERLPQELIEWNLDFDRRYLTERLARVDVARPTRILR